MSFDSVKPTVNVQIVHPKQDADEQSSRDSRRDDKQRQPDQPRHDQPSPFRNALGQLTGSTINITA